MSRYEERIYRLATEARERRVEFEPPPSPPDEERALSLLRSGLAPVVSVYIEARTDGDVRFERDELALLHQATNDFLDCYGLCYGVELDADFTVREVAEMVVKTHNIRDTAAMLTGVPESG